MSDQGASRGAMQRSNYEFGPTRLNSTSFDDELLVDNADLSFNQKSLSHQSQQIIPLGLTEGFIESSMWVGRGTRLQARRFPANSEQQDLLNLNLSLSMQILPLGRGTLMRSLLPLRGLNPNILI